jgi:hypothetical protein
VFLLLGADHRAISPDSGEADRIRAYCHAHDIPTGKFTHYAAPSEVVLPTLADEAGLDVVLVDGSHSFPIPCIDWFYTTRLLKQGGIMIIDDIQLWSGKVLVDFLDAEEVWQQITRKDRFAIYRLLADSKAVVSRWWGEQPYVVRHSNHMSYAIRRWVRRNWPFAGRQNRLSQAGEEKTTM